MNIHRHIGTQPRRSLDTAFSNFLTNLSIDGTYTVNTAVLERAYNAIPYEAADADIIMVAGAYKSGSIACYDNNGNIVDLGFSRSTTRFKVFDEILDTPIDTPRLDNDTYSMSIGYLIEKMGNYSGTSRAFQGSGLVGTTPLLNSPQTFTEIHNNTVNRNSFYNDTNPQHYNTLSGVNGGIILYVKPNQHIITTGQKLRVNNPKGSLRIRFDNLTYEMITNNGIEKASFTKQRNGWYKLYLELNATDTGWFSIQMISTRNNNQENYMPIDTNVEYKIGTITYGRLNGAESPNYHIGAHYSNRAVDADIIAPITLTNDALIHIKTANRLQTVSLNSGQSFNVSDYVVNDKLILFTIKYI